MQVLHVVHGFPPEFQGGTECYVRRLAEAQRDRGLRVSVLTGTEEVTAAHAAVVAVDEKGLPVHALRRFGLCGDRWDQAASPEAEARIAALLRRTRPDVLHLHHWIRLCRSVARLGAAAGIPVVWTLHDLSSTCPRLSRVLDDGTLCRQPLAVAHCLGCAPSDPWQHREELAEAIEEYAADLAAEQQAACLRIAPSAAQRDFLAPLHGLGPERYVVLPHGMLHRLRCCGPRPADPAGRLRLVHWGFWYRDKGVHVLLEALRRLHGPERERVHLTLYGQAVFPAYAREIEQLAAGLPVTLAGAFDPSALPGERFDLAVLPTLAHESHSFVLDEAFALGLPVLASRIGALPERVGAAGALFPPGDAAALAACLEEAIRDPRRLEAWRARLPAAPLDMDEHAGALEPLYRAAIAAGPPADAPRPPRRDSARRLRERLVASRELEIHRLHWHLEFGSG